MVVGAESGSTDPAISRFRKNLRADARDPTGNSEGDMTELEQLIRMIGREFPSATIRLESPRSTLRHAAHWLEIKLDDQFIVVEWKPGRGFGISRLDGHFGEGHDEVADDANSAIIRIVGMLRNGLEVRQ